MMKTAPTISILLLASTTAFAGETRTGDRSPPSDPERELILPAGEISAAAEPWTPQVRASWLRHATRRARSDGNLRVEVIVDPAGVVWRHAFVYAGPRNRPLDRCLQDLVAKWRFPWRRGYTQAAVPYLFRASAGSGPYLSCWKPRGCSRPRRP
jgi:outer membrane biosynthesis protein TonB